MAETVSGMFQQVVGRHGGRPAFRYRTGEEYTTITFSELAARVEALATALLDLGVVPGQKLGLISDNRPEWILCDLACISIGVPDVPRGSDSTAREIEYILGHAEASGVFVEDARRLERIAPLRERLPGLRFLVVMDPEWAGPAAPGVHRLADLLERGRVLRAGGDRRLEAARDAIRPEDTATIIYTSGTTGEPKGVVLAHRNLMQNANVLPGLLQITFDDLFILLLPPWHIFERQVEYTAMAAGACQSYSCIRTLGADMASEKPTFMASVPRVWEGILGRVTANITKESAAKQRIFGLLLRVSKRYVRASKVLQGRDTLYAKPSPAARLVTVLQALLTVVLLAPIYAFAQKKFAAIRLRTGGRLRAAVSGGGALPPYVDEFFAAVGITLLEAYGLTETSPGLAVRTFDRQVLGTVGAPIPGAEIRIVDEQGRDLPQGRKGIVLCRGGMVMVGYYKRPEATAKVLSADGWFNTGDLGRMTTRGELSLTGRAKETIVLLGGENIEPQPIEDALKESPFISQVMVVGQDKKHLGALIVPGFDAIRDWLAEQGATGGTSPEEICKRQEVYALVKQELHRLMTEERGFKYYERIPRFALLPREFAVGEELTQTMKLRRNVIDERYAAQIASLFR
ncbi:MAG: AMP-dependent synthetase/ligase [Candidatus Methylomirabilia bacterium]